MSLVISPLEPVHLFSYSARFSSLIYLGVPGILAVSIIEIKRRLLTGLHRYMGQVLDFQFVVVLPPLPKTLGQQIDVLGNAP